MQLQHKFVWQFAQLGRKLTAAKPQNQRPSIPLDSSRAPPRRNETPIRPADAWDLCSQIMHIYFSVKANGELCSRSRRIESNRIPCRIRIQNVVRIENRVQRGQRAHNKLIMRDRMRVVGCQVVPNPVESWRILAKAISGCASFGSPCISVLAASFPHHSPDLCALHFYSNLIGICLWP